MHCVIWMNVCDFSTSDEVREVLKNATTLLVSLTGLGVLAVLNLSMLIKVFVPCACVQV